jgi:hypothetical protein
MLRLWVSGDATVIQVQSTYILAPALLGMMPSPAWAIDCFNSRAWRLRDRIDGRERWLVHNFLPAVDRDRRVPAILGVGFEFDQERLDWAADDRCFFKR